MALYKSFIMLFLIIFLVSGCSEPKTVIINEPASSQEPQIVGSVDNVQEKKPEPIPPKNLSQPITPQTIVIKNFNFFPKDISIKKGSFVVWKHEDEYTSRMFHMIKVHGINIKSHRMALGEQFSYQFNETGEFKYFDVIYAADMETGMIIVTE